MSDSSYPLVIAKWVDRQRFSAWTPTENLPMEPREVETTGRLVYQDSQLAIIAGSIADEGLSTEIARDVIAIPKASIFDLSPVNLNP